MISAVIPVYNEAGCIAPGIAAMERVLRQAAGDDWELILVDDGSSDDTRSVIERTAREHGHVVGRYHEHNQGKGAAVRTGVLASRGDLVLFCDADMSTPPETLLEFMEHITSGRADVVVGNRKSPQATIERWQPRLRTQLGLGFTRLANAMTGLAMSDYTCGFKLFRGAPGREIFEATRTPRWSFDVEVLARAARAGLRIHEVPVRWSHVDDTRVRVLRDVVNSFLELLAIRRRLGRMPRRAR